MVHRTYNRLIVHALLEPSFAAALLVDPRLAALREGYSVLLAESLVGLRGATLNEFAASLHRRIYGRAAEISAGVAHVQPATPNVVIPFRRAVRG